jgi:hypothetical protein
MVNVSLDVRIGIKITRTVTVYLVKFIIKHIANVCTNVTCLHGGKCTITSNKVIDCICPSQYVGLFCQVINNPTAVLVNISKRLYFNNLAAAIADISIPLSKEDLQTLMNLRKLLDDSADLSTSLVKILLALSSKFYEIKIQHNK